MYSDIMEKLRKFKSNTAGLSIYHFVHINILFGVKYKPETCLKVWGVIIEYTRHEMDFYITDIQPYKMNTVDILFLYKTDFKVVTNWSTDIQPYTI